MFVVCAVSNSTCKLDVANRVRVAVGAYVGAQF